MVRWMRPLILVVLLALGGYAMNIFGLSKAWASEFRSVSVTALAAQLKAPNPPFLLDVREPSEFAENKIEGATLIPLGTLPARVGELPKDRPIVVYCRSGNRSSRAAAFLVEHDFEDVENLTGGMNAWLTR